MASLTDTARILRFLLIPGVIRMGVGEVVRIRDEESSDFIVLRGTGSQGPEVIDASFAIGSFQPPT